MGNFNRGGYQPRGRSSFGGGGRSFDRGSDRGGDRPMFKTICSNCGKECEVPFQPTNGKPVYCSECFEKMGNRRDDSPRPERSDFRPQAPIVDQNKGQFENINIKLDKILRLLEPKVVEDPEMNSGLTKVKSSKAKKPASSKKE